LEHFVDFEVPEKLRPVQEKIRAFVFDELEPVSRMVEEQE